MIRTEFIVKQVANGFILELNKDNHVVQGGSNELAVYMSDSIKSVIERKMESCDFKVKIEITEII